MEKLVKWNNLHATWSTYKKYTIYNLKIFSNEVWVMPVKVTGLCV
jgi:hypothetical protein